MDIKRLLAAPHALPSSGTGTSALPDGADSPFARLVNAATGKLPQNAVPQDNRPRHGLPQAAAAMDASTRGEQTPASIDRMAILNQPPLPAPDPRANSHLNSLADAPAREPLERHPPAAQGRESEVEDPLIALIAMVQGIGPLNISPPLRPTMQEQPSMENALSAIPVQAMPARNRPAREIVSEMVDSTVRNELPDTGFVEGSTREGRYPAGALLSGAGQAQALSTPVTASQAPALQVQATSTAVTPQDAASSAARLAVDGAISPAAKGLEDFDPLLDGAGSSIGQSRQENSIASMQGSGVSTAGPFGGLASGPSITAPLQSPQWPQQLGQQLVALTQRGEQQMELRLNPEELGPLAVTLKLSDHGAQAHFLSGHAQVRGLIEQAIPQLRDALAQQGIELGETSVGEQGFQDSRREGEERQPGARTRHFAVSENDVMPELALTSRSVSRLDGRVDLYA